MKIVNYNNTNHQIKIVPRYYPIDTLEIHLHNESENINNIVPCTYSILDGYVIINFDFDFIDKDRFSFKIMENTNVVYMGMIFSTIEETQNYKQSNYIYEF